MTGHVLKFAKYPDDLTHYNPTRLSWYKVSIIPMVQLYLVGGLNPSEKYESQSG